jgi:hypothetical protein
MGVSIVKTSYRGKDRPSSSSPHILRVIGVTEENMRLPLCDNIRFSVKMEASSAVASKRSRKLSSYTFSACRMKVQGYYTPCLS